jgi:hypothetical protein
MESSAAFSKGGLQRKALLLADQGVAREFEVDVQE